MEDSADGMVKDSRFIFLRDRGLLGWGKGKDSDESEVAEDRAEAADGVSPFKRAIWLL